MHSHRIPPLDTDLLVYYIPHIGYFLSCIDRVISLAFIVALSFFGSNLVAGTFRSFDAAAAAAPWGCGGMLSNVVLATRRRAQSISD